MKIRKQLNDLIKVIVEEAKANPQFEKRLEDVLLKSITPKQVSKRKNKRALAAFDPFEIFQESGEMLREKLNELNIEKLKDIIAEYGMDQSKLAMKWKSQDRLIEHIITTVEARSRKGDAFRVS
jgi:phosphopentomutase